jgi:hypothetical protein
MSDDEKPKPLPDPTRPVKEKVFRDMDFAMRDKKKMSILSMKAKEEELIDAMDQIKAMRRMGPLVKKLLNKKVSLEQAFKENSTESFLMLMKMAFSDATSEKVKADILKHFLALAGHNPAQRHQIERVDPNTPKEALLAMLSGAGKDLAGEGIEVVDDRRGIPPPGGWPDSPIEDYKGPDPMTDSDEDYET